MTQLVEDNKSLKAQVTGLTDTVDSLKRLLERQQPLNNHMNFPPLTSNANAFTFIPPHPATPLHTKRSYAESAAAEVGIVNPSKRLNQSVSQNKYEASSSSISISRQALPAQK